MPTKVTTYFLSNKSKTFASNITENKKSILIDTGASCHILCDDTLFKTFDLNFNPSSTFLELADGSRHNDLIRGKGDAIIPLYDIDGNLQQVTLKGALYVPSFHRNILSYYHAVADGIRFDLNNQGNEIMFTQEGLTFKVTTKGHLYLLNHVTCSTVVTRSVTDWHRYLGHSNLKDLAKLPAVSTNMKISSRGSSDKACEICIMGKSTRHVNKTPDARGTSPFSSVYCDLNGPIVEDNESQFKYVFGAICDYSQYIYVYLMRSKSDTPAALKQFLADISPYGLPRKIRSDFGTEFCGNQFQEIILNRGIRHEKCAPYSPHQIGHIERSWRTLFDTARTLLYDSGVPHNLWPYAVKMAAYQINRRYQDRIKLTPLEKATGRRPNMANLYLFGCKCFAYVQKKTKLEPRSVPAIFLGYDDHSPAYIIYFPDTNSIKKVKDVTFTDNMYYKNTISNKPGTPASNQHEKVIPESNVPQSGGAGGPPRLAHPSNISPDTDTESSSLQTPPPTKNTSEAGRYPVRPRSKPDLYGNIVNSETVDDLISNCNFVQCLNVNHTIIQIPNTYKQAMKSPEKEYWIKAMDDEMKSLLANGTYKLVKRPHKCKPIGGRWVYSVKTDQFGNYKFKARFVAQGFKQILGFNYTNTFAPTPHMTTIRLFMNISIEFGLITHHMDVCNAYLNSELPSEDKIFMTQPEGYVTDDNLVCKLNKSLYGLKQSAFLWNKTLINFMQSQNLFQSIKDPCVFIRKTDKDTLYVLIWVDDIIISASSTDVMNIFKTNLSNRFKVKDLGPLKWFLGIQFDITDKCISMNQSLYVKTILSRFSMTDCTPRTLPCDPKVYTLLERDSDKLENPKKYQELIGSLIWLMTGTRPDIVFVTTLLSRFMQEPTTTHMAIALDVLRYLKYTIHYDLRFVKTGNKLQLFGFSDADYSSDPLDRKSISGYCFKLIQSSGLISWRSCKQELIAGSSCESEFIAMYESSKEALFLRQILSEFTNKPPQTVKMYADNQGAISLAQHPAFHKRTKHIEVKYLTIRLYIEKQFIHLSWIPSRDNTADMFTKPLGGTKLKTFSNIRGGPWNFHVKKR